MPLKVKILLAVFLVSPAIFFLAGIIALENDPFEEAPDLQALSQATPVPAVSRAELAGGVWNDGQAAIWDINVFDHFHYFGPPERARGYRPEQPIQFSHRTHAGNNRIECQYCHWSVAKSPFAAVPEVETCQGCHKLVLGMDREQSVQDEIKKIAGYLERNEPIPWQKVHVMPDHVKFNHKRHVKAGVACQTCHGQIPKMEVVERVSSMKMGWCVSCHREQGASIDCYTCHR